VSHCRLSAISAGSLPGVVVCPLLFLLGQLAPLADYSDPGALLKPTVWLQTWRRVRFSFLSEMVNKFLKYKALFQTIEHDQYCANFDLRQVTGVLLLERIKSCNIVCEICASGLVLGSILDSCSSRMSLVTCTMHILYHFAFPSGNFEFSIRYRTYG
jgi:hypothetical protein